LNIAKFGSILPNLGQYCQIWVNIAKFGSIFFKALEQYHKIKGGKKKHCYIHPDVIIELHIRELRRLGDERTASFGIIGHQTRNWE
jgi:hypothetical protein